MQKFARRVIAWARFERVVAYRKQCVKSEEEYAHYLIATNVIGKYWKRRGEKIVLKVRFRNRLKVGFVFQTS